MNAIVTVDECWGIGRGGGMLFDLPKDLAYFREKTIGKVVVMGRGTLLSLPGGRPLKNRVNIVLSGDASLETPGISLVRSLPELFAAIAQYDTDDVFVIGGQSVYEQLLDYCRCAYVTKVRARRSAEVFFPNIDEMPQWELVSQSEEQWEGQLEYTYCTYRNMNTKEC